MYYIWFCSVLLSLLHKGKYMLCWLVSKAFVQVVVMAEWLRRPIRNLLGFPRASSNPADYVTGNVIFKTLQSFIGGISWWNLKSPNGDDFFVLWGNPHSILESSSFCPQRWYCQWMQLLSFVVVFFAFFCTTRNVTEVVCVSHNLRNFLGCFQRLWKVNYITMHSGSSLQLL